MFWNKNKRRIRKTFLKFAGRDQLIDFAEWKNALDVNNDFLAKRMFQLADTDNSSYIDQTEFTLFANTLLNKDLNVRFKYIFQLCDLDDSGHISHDNLKKIVESSLSEQGLSLTADKTDSLISSFFEQAEVKRKAGINEEEFIELLATLPDIEKQFDSFIYKMLGIEVSHKQKKMSGISLGKRLKRRYIDNGVPYLWLLAYLGSNIWLFNHSMQTYAEQGANLAIQIARGAGACLYLTVALLLLPMCKSILTGLRHSFLFRFLPLENLNDIHRHLAYAIILFSAVHLGAHIYNYWAEQINLENVLLYSMVGITGLLLTCILIIMWLGNRYKREHHESFVSIHLLYAPFLIALLFHASDFWIWILPGIILYGLDGLYRTLVKYRKVDITELRSLSDRVTQVKFKRGKLFHFHPGDYIRVRIPLLSRIQWHPFTISAAPGSDRLDIHVRNNGDWSGALHNLANQQHPQAKKWKAYIDGPYSAATSSIYRSKVAILIAGGIGITPFASVLQSLISSHHAQKDKNAGQVIYFHWLNRSQKSYEWFVDLLTRAEEQLGKEKFHLFIHLTSLARNLSNIVMQLALDAYWKKFQQDPLTNLNAKTSAGRPNWDKIFKEIAEIHHNNKVDIYFCGPKELGTSIKKMALKHGLYYREEKFE